MLILTEGRRNRNLSRIGELESPAVAGCEDV